MEKTYGVLTNSMHRCMSLLCDLNPGETPERRRQLSKRVEECFEQGLDLLTIKRAIIGSLYLLDCFLSPMVNEADETLIAAITGAQSKVELQNTLHRIERGEDAQPQDDPYERYATYAYNYINSHFCGNVQLKTIAQELYITPSYLSRIIKERYGARFVDILADVRIRHSKALLLSTKNSIKYIAEASGFSDYIYFYKIFCKNVGQSPAQFRLCHRNSAEAS